MKKISLLFLLCVSVLSFAQQHGINTTNPKATLEIKAATNGSLQPEGLLIPSLTDAEIQAMPVTTYHAGMMIYNSTMDCVQIYSASQWKCVGIGANNGLAAYLNATYAGSTGVWIQNYSATGNSISFQVANNSNMSFSQLNLNNALQLTNASAGLSYTAAADYSNITIGAGTVSTFTYNITGTPTTAGTLTANFNASGGISAYGNITIVPRSEVQAISMAFVGDYVSNKQLDFNDHSVQLTIKNNSSNPLSNADLSNAVTLNGVSGITLQPNQNTDVNIPAGQTVVLTYKIGGIATAPETLTATFNPNQQVSGSATASQQVRLFDRVSASNLLINGTYQYGQNMTPSNTVSLTLTNNNAYALQQINLSQALALSGAVNNITVAPNQNTSVNIPANASITLTYHLDGTSMVQGGGTLTATFSQTPFPTLTATKNVLGNNSFYATPNAVTSPMSGGTYTFNIASTLPWNATLSGDAANWITISNTTGTDGNGTITITTQPKTSQYAQIGYITVTRPGDGATIQIAVNQAPTDNFQVTNFSSQVPQLESTGADFWVSIHNNKTSTITTNQTNLQVYGALPDFIESVTFNGNQIILTPKERVTPGASTSSTIRFSYGNGYLSPLYTIVQNQKASKCPANPPIAGNGYRIWNSINEYNPQILYSLVETRQGVDDFSDYTLINPIYFRMPNGNGPIEYLTQDVIQDANSSSLFIKFSTGLSSRYNSTQDFWTYNYFLIYKNLTNNEIGAHSFNQLQSIPDMTDRVGISPIICTDGYDEDTPNVTGNAGWRQ